LNARTHILAAADRCVMCGLCLPHCPTYQLHHSEAESPRGRIALMQALANGRLEMSEALTRHLDSCLVCRACEKMCPSKVEYGELIDTTRGLLHTQG
jgi:glycolate oxidase iron-sulfur subunit